MLLTFEDIEHLIISKESNSLEIKETTGQLTRGMETGCAFMNSINGGYLLFGINDKGKIIGQEVSDKTKKEIAGALRRFEPTVFTDVQYIPIPTQKNKYVIAIHFEDLFRIKHLSLSGKIIKAEREEELSIPYKALREAVINALCHRDYVHPGSSSGIAIYNDRVEIINTGRLPKGIDITRLTSPHKSMPNNPLIANVLYRRKMLESWGRGLELMYSECKRVGLPTPTLLDYEGEVVVTFYFKKQATEQATEQVASLTRILADKEMSIKEILEALSLKHRPTLLYDYIQPAMKLGIVEQTQPESPKSPKQKYRLTGKGKTMI